MKSIQYFKDKIKGFGSLDKSLIFQAFIIIIVAIGSFLLGRISVDIKNDAEVDIVSNQDIKLDISSKNYPKIPIKTTLSQSDASGKYVASKNGKLYYRIGCGASSRIKNENKVFFDTMKDAEEGGFQGSSSCTP